MGRPSIIELEPVPLEDEELVARLFRALGDVTRLRILERLAEEGPLPQKDLVSHVGLSQGRVSQHMACLEWCGFITAQRQGRKVIYRLASPKVGAIIDLARVFLDTTEGDIGSCRVVGTEGAAGA